MAYNRVYTFQFDMRDVVNLFQLEVRRRYENHIYVDCPFCNNKRKGKLNINFEKDTYRCNYNDRHSGGMLDFYANLRNVDRKTAYDEIMEALGLNDDSGTEKDNKKKRVHRKIKPLPPPPIPFEVLYERHITYTMLLQVLSLQPRHRSNLLWRGLTNELIEKLGYKSVLPAWQLELVAHLQSLGCTFKNVPGFYTLPNGQWTIAFNSFTEGILVPFRAPDGMILGLQIRLDKPIDGGKCVWFSSEGKENGCSPGSPMHFVGHTETGVIYVSEGAMKGDIASFFSGKTFGLTAGAGPVEAYEIFFTKMVDMGFEHAVEAYDMDKLTNPDVERTALKMVDAAQRIGLKASRLFWPPETKGIDDREKRRVELLSNPILLPNT